jgi:hypothetical protein
MIGRATQLALIAVALGAAVRPARGEVSRYAVIVGNNEGDRGEAQLRYAERDAERVASVLIDLGGFPPANVVTLLAADADAVRAALIAVNDRIRSERGSDAMLVVYYSGHADASALHLGRTTLATSQLEQLVRGSAAGFRLLALDSCRSGVLTRVKGGTLAPPIPIVVGDTIAADGVVFWTASAASEDAQEADDIQGAFFTHYLVSGLAGPADVNGDGAVTTNEAFEYARAATLRASSRTLAGPQHATFRDELHGRQDVALTTPGAAGQMAAIELPAGRDAVVMANGEAGRIVGEIAATDRARRMALRPGRYFIRERTDGYLLEGTVTAVAGPARRIADGELARVAYAALVRKGGRGRQDAAFVGLSARSALLDGRSACVGPAIGYAVALAWATITTQLRGCRERSVGPFVASTLSELGASLGGAHVWDVGRFGLALGGRLGAAVLREDFSTTGRAPDRSELAPTFGLTAAAATPLAAGIELSLDLEATSYLFRRIGMTGPASWASPVVGRAGLTVGLLW